MGNDVLDEGQGATTCTGCTAQTDYLAGLEMTSLGLFGFGSSYQRHTRQHQDISRQPRKSFLSRKDESLCS